MQGRCRRCLSGSAAGDTQFEASRLHYIYALLSASAGSQLRTVCGIAVTSHKKHSVLCTVVAAHEGLLLAGRSVDGVVLHVLTWFVTTSPCCVHSCTHAGADSSMRNFASELHAPLPVGSGPPPLEGRPTAMTPAKHALPTLKASRPRPRSPQTTTLHVKVS